MSKAMRNSAVALLVVFLLVVLWLSYCLWLWFSPLLNTKPTSFKVYPNETPTEVVHRLAQRGLITHPGLMMAAKALINRRYRLHFGEYHVAVGMSLEDLLARIDARGGLVRHRIRFIEGQTFLQMKQRLLADHNLRHQLTGKSNTQIMALLGAAKSPPEGLFFPDTYQFVWGNTDTEILRQAYQLMNRVLLDEWQHRQSGLPYKTPYQALIVASLIEVESGLTSERPLIAGVILQRLRRKMRLQIDPTVTYGLNKPYGSSLTRYDLSMKTPYNTYVIRGLPPTPIDMPSRSSLHAALHPASSHYYYYMSRGDGSHRFSKTYRAHQRAVLYYRRTQQQKKQTELFDVTRFAKTLRPILFLLWGMMAYS